MEERVRKMKSKGILALIIALLLFTMTACPKTPTAEEVVLSVDFASEENLSRYDSFIDRYVEAEYAVRVMITTNTTIKEFRYFEVGNRAENDEIVFFEDYLLFELDELTAKVPLVAAAEFPGIFPTKGLSYVDSANAKKSFLVVESGEDGSLFLLEF
jgi:hypothetical protein